MYLGFILIVALSLLAQAAAAVLALRLMGITRTNKAWMLVAVAMLAMAIRRATVLAGILAYPSLLDSMDYWSEAIGLLSTLALLAGFAAIGPLFRTIQRAKDDLQQARDQLEKEIREQTADLLRANEELQAEFVEKAKVEEALRDKQRHLLQVIEICERDQRLLAYEIHDGFVQPATAALMNLHASLSAYSSDPELALANVARGVQLLQESIAEVRWLVSGMRPVVLEDMGLVAAVDKLVEETEGRTGVAIAWTHQVAFGRLAPPLEMSIFRVIQEALRNAVRHGRAERIEVTLSQVDKTIVVRVKDWGCGFDMSLKKPGHFGLESMRERARLFGGAARIESAPGAGTCVTAEFPLIEKEAKT